MFENFVHLIHSSVFCVSRRRRSNFTCSFISVVKIHLQSRATRDVHMCSPRNTFTTSSFGKPPAIVFHRGVAGDLGIDHQRVRDPIEERAPAVPTEGVDSAPQAEVCTSVSPAAELLHRAIRGKGSGYSDAGVEGKERGGKA